MTSASEFTDVFVHCIIIKRYIFVIDVSKTIGA